jgi:hypothetical protein
MNRSELDLPEHRHAEGTVASNPQSCSATKRRQSTAFWALRFLSSWFSFVYMAFLAARCSRFMMAFPIPVSGTLYT